jgi:hypothetical protein
MSDVSWAFLFGNASGAMLAISFVLWRLSRRAHPTEADRG